MESSPSQKVEDLIRERARLDVELERCRELVTVLFMDIVSCNTSAISARTPVSMWGLRQAILWLCATCRMTRR